MIELVSFLKALLGAKSKPKEVVWVSNIQHPELRAGEIFLTNSSRNGAESGWKSKRVGVVAYCLDGTIAKGHRPVFIKQQEAIDAGLLRVGDLSLGEQK